MEDISSTQLLNSTMGAVSQFIDDTLNSTVQQQQFFESKILMLENEIGVLTKSEILLENQMTKLVESKDIELSFDKNLKEYQMVFYKVKQDEIASQRFHFYDSMQQGLLFSNKIDTISSIVGSEHINAFDMLCVNDGIIQTSKGFNETQLLRPPTLLLNTRPASPLSDTTSIQQQLSQPSLIYNFDNIENEIIQLQTQLLQSIQQSSVQLLKVTQQGEFMIPLSKQQTDDQQPEKIKWRGTFQINKSISDICIQTDPQSLILTENKQTYSGNVVQKIIEKIVEVPVETLLIVQHIVEQQSSNFNQFDFDKLNVQFQQQQQNTQSIKHTNDKTRQMYDKVISQNDFLRQQVISLIDQLQQNKRQMQKNKQIIAQLEVKINNTATRDFYKVKLSDLEKKIQDRTKVLDQLNRNIITTQLKDSQSNQGTDELIKHYEFTFSQMSQQIQALKTKIYELREKQSSVIENQSSKISRYIDQIQSRQKQIQHLSRANQQYRSQLLEQMQTNSNIKKMAQQLWEQNQQLSSKILNSQNQIEIMNENQSKLIEEKSDIDQLNILVASLTQQITVIKEQLRLKQQKQNQSLGLNQSYQHIIRQYESEIQMQSMTIEQFKNTCDKSEQYIMLLNQQIHSLKRKQTDTKSSQIKPYLGSITNLKLHQHSQYNPSDITQFKQLLSLHTHTNKQQPNSINSSMQQPSNLQQQQYFISQMNSFSSSIIQQLTTIIKQSIDDIQTLQSQNKYLQNLITQYEKIISQQPKVSQDQVVKLMVQNQRLQKQIMQMQGNNIDINFFQQIVNQLQRSKQLNTKLEEELRKLKREVTGLELEMNEKQQKIHYLSAIKQKEINVDNDNSFIKRLETENQDYRQGIEQVLDINKTLEASIQKLSQIKNQEIQQLNNEIAVLEDRIIPNLHRQIRQLTFALQNTNTDKKKVSQIYSGRRYHHHSKSAISMLQRYYFVASDSIDTKNKIASTSKRLNPIQCSLIDIKPQLIKFQTMLQIIFRIAQYIQQKLSKSQFKLLSPKSVIILNYSQTKPELIQIMTISVNPQQLQLFTPPQTIINQQSACAWNLGILLDHLIHGETFFKSKEQIINKQFEFRNSNQEEFKQLKSVIQGLVKKVPEERESVEKTLEALKEVIQQTESLID